MTNRPFIKKIKHIKFELGSTKNHPNTFLHKFKSIIKRYPTNNGDRKSMIKLFDRFIVKWIEDGTPDLNTWSLKYINAKIKIKNKPDEKNIIRNGNTIYGIGYPNRFIIKPLLLDDIILINITLYNQHKISQKIRRRVLKGQK